MTTQAATMRVRAGRAHGDPAHWFHDVLSRDQERDLLERIQGGDRAARDELILKNQRLVIHIAKRSLGGLLDLDDLVSAGNRGLIRAVERFDPARQVRFSTYAVRWIQATILCEVRDTGHPIRVSSWVLSLSGAFRKVEERLHDLEGAPPGFARVCQAMRLSEGQCRCLSDALGVTGAEFVSCETEPLPLDREASPDRVAEEEDLRSYAERLVGRLPLRQAQVLRLHFGLGGEPQLSLVEIGRREGWTWQAVQNTRNQALERLRRMVAAESVLDS